MARTLLGALLNRAPVDTPVPFASRGQTRALPFLRPAGVTGQMRAMGSVGTLFSIVNRTSNATAMVDWKLYRKAKSGMKEDRVEVTSHAALDLWNKPNPFMPRRSSSKPRSSTSTSPAKAGGSSPATPGSRSPWRCGRYARTV